MVQAWSHSPIIDRGTFGNSRACHYLVDMMNDGVVSIRDRHKVLSFFSSVSSYFKNIMLLPNARTRAGVMEVMLAHYKNKIDETFPQEIKSFMKNVLLYLYRKHLEKERNV